MNNNERYILHCCGSRGSKSIEGHKFNEFGGYTSCYVLRKGDYALVIDCGTGFYSATSFIAGCKNIDIVLTHMHYDHILGLLDWNRMPKGANVNYYARLNGWFGEKSLEEFFRQPFWPVTPKFNVHEAPENNRLVLNESLNVSFYPSSHPDAASLIIIEDFSNAKEKTDKIVVMFDCEDPNCIDRKLIDGCNILIYDGCYDDEDYYKYKGWGHSTWQTGCRLAEEIQCDRLIITHHEPTRTDDELRSREKRAKKMYPYTDFARSGQEWNFPYRENEVLKSSNKDKGKFDLFIEDLGDIFSDALTDLGKMRNLCCEISCALMAAISFVMTIVNVVTNQAPVLYATLVFTVLCLVNVYLFIFRKNRRRLATTIFELEIIMLMAFFMITGSPEGFSIIWALLIPTAGMLVFGRFETTMVSAITLFIMLVLFRTDFGNSLLMYQYTDSFLLRFPLAFTAFYAVGLFLETIRRKTLSMLNETRDEQEEKISTQTKELREVNDELKQVNSRLEERSSLLFKTFGKLMPDEIVSKLVSQDGKLDFVGKREFITALQVDIRGFTALSNRLEAMSVMKMLNHYLSEMTEIIQSHNGMVMEFIGDGILAVFGAPTQNASHAEDAVVTAILMQNKMKEINEWNLLNGYPPIEVGIGVNSGDAVLGVVGSESRLKYDVVGRTINVTSRIETYSVGGQILISQDTLDRINCALDIDSKFTVLPKGLETNLTIYGISGIKGKHNISCPKSDEVMKPLEHSEKVSFRKALADDQFELKPHQGEIIAVSSKGLILKSRVKMDLFSNVNIDYRGGVIGMITQIAGNEYTVTFTFAPEFKEQK